ncbi:MAG TPA: GntR family transcriptional regulator, partial [Streptosporangiaceae bacterium]
MTSEPAAALARPRGSDVAYQQLREMILDLRLPPGTVANEQELAARLRLGRMPVREAIARLVSDRFLVVHPRQSTLVTGFGLDDILDMFDAREALECGVAHIAARRAEPGDLATLRRLMEGADRAREGTDHEAFLRDDHEIHTFLAHMIRNRLLQDAA